VRDVEVDVLRVVVVTRPEGDGEAHLPQGVVGPLVTPKKGLVGMRRSLGTCIFS
jgi:hypothetical protein